MYAIGKFSLLIAIAVTFANAGTAINPCTGAETKRNSLLAQATTGAPAGLVRYRGGKTDFSPATRAVGFDIASGTSEGSRGIVAGSFVQPILVSRTAALRSKAPRSFELARGQEYIFPELTVFGLPQIPLDYNRIPYLAQGSGPFSPGNLLSPPPASPPIVGQLRPWPGAPAPATTPCPTGVPATTSTPTSPPTSGPSLTQ